MLYRLKKFKQRLSLAWMVLIGRDSLIVKRDKNGIVRYYSYQDGDLLFFVLSEELKKYGIEWLTDWLKKNSIDDETY